MRIEPKQAFYNDATGAVQPWKDIEVTDTVGNALVAEGLVTEIEGGGGGGDFKSCSVTAVATNGTSFDLRTVLSDDEKNTGMFVDEEGFSPYLGAPEGGSTTKTLMYIGNSTELQAYIIVTNVEGDAEYDSDTDIITIWGDCTITGWKND